jgi:hypothetical protein
MHGPPPKEKRACNTAFKVTTLLAAYRVLDVFQTPFGFVFWKIEQVKSNLHDRLANAGGEE